MRSYVRSVETIELEGGWLCLNFTNTVSNRFKEPLLDYLEEPADWLLWIKRLQLASAQDIGKIEKFAKNNEMLAEDQLKEIISFREALYNIFHALTRQGEPGKNSIELFNQQLSLTLQKLNLKVYPDGVVGENWKIAEHDLLVPFYPIVKSAYELLTSYLLPRVKECDNCGWLFLDKSKNQSRRWCSMHTCGSSDKSKRYYRKKKNA